MQLDPFLSTLIPDCFSITAIILENKQQECNNMDLCMFLPKMNDLV